MKIKVVLAVLASFLASNSAFAGEWSSLMGSSHTDKYYDYVFHNTSGFKGGIGNDSFRLSGTLQGFGYLSGQDRNLDKHTFIDMAFSDVSLALTGRASSFVLGRVELSTSSHTIFEPSYKYDYDVLNKYIQPYQIDKLNLIRLREASITIANFDVTPVFIRLANGFIPFGNIDFNRTFVSNLSHMTALHTHFVEVGVADSSGFSARAYMFNNKNIEVEKALDRSRTLNNYGLSLGYNWDLNNIVADLKIDYLHNAMETKFYNDLYGELNKFYKDAQNSSVNVLALERVLKSIPEVSVTLKALYYNIDASIQYIHSMKELDGDMLLLVGDKHGLDEFNKNIADKLHRDITSIKYTPKAIALNAGITLDVKGYDLRFGARYERFISSPKVQLASFIGTKTDLEKQESAKYEKHLYNSLKTPIQYTASVTADLKVSDTFTVGIELFTNKHQLSVVTPSEAGLEFKKIDNEYGALLKLSLTLI